MSTSTEVKVTMSDRTPSMRGNRSGRGRSGRGISRGRSYHNPQPRRHYENPKKNLSDYIYYIGTSKQVNDYHATTKYLINYIKKPINTEKILEML